MTRRSSAMAVAIITASTALLARQGTTPGFRFERAIVLSGPGLYRLAVDATLLSGAAPFSIGSRPSPTTGEPVPVAEGGLADLRLFDTANREVPYLLVRPGERKQTRAPLAVAATPLAVEHRPSEPGTSRYAIRLPGNRLPIVAITLDVGAVDLLREATVTEPRLLGLEAAPHVLGRATLKRVTRGGLAAFNLRIPIDAPLESQLDLAIDDGDNPPLTLAGVTAEFAELPWIFFQSDGSPIVARYGRTDVQAPKYDLEAARDSLRIGSAREARWASPAALAPEATGGGLPTVSLAGAEIDAGPFRRVRPLPPGEAGLVTLPLDADVLAESARRGFADVRVVDGANRQIPYLVERRSEPMEIPLTLERITSAAADRTFAREGAGRLSVYRARLPHATLPVFTIAVSTDARVFDRRVAAGVERPPDRRSREPWIERLATARWIQKDPARPARSLSLTVLGTASDALLVIVDEGDNAPLPISTVRLLLPSYRLRFYRPAGGALRLMYGRDDLSAPRYDLALLAPQVLGVAAIEATADPANVPPGRGGSIMKSPYLFWGVLGGAVVILFGLLARLLRTPTDPTPS